MDYGNMTDAQLEKENQKLMREKDAIREEQRKIGKILDQRAAEKKIAALSDAEREALLGAMRTAKPPAQTVAGVGGIKSKTQFGDIGGRTPKRGARR